MMATLTTIPPKPVPTSFVLELDEEEARAVYQIMLDAGATSRQTNEAVYEAMDLLEKALYVA